MNLGLIALDIDGTITNDVHSIPKEVLCYLKSLWKSGWQFVFITGRTLSFAMSTLHEVDFPFYFAVQNGADILLMPDKKLLHRAYLSSTILQEIENLYQRRKEDYIIYAGYEKGDFCYYRPERFSEDLRNYLEKIKALAPEPWKEMTSFSFSSPIEFPLIKCLGKKEEMYEINTILKNIQGINATFIHDPLSENAYYLNLVTSSKASKGQALKHLENLFGTFPIVIAAGDDLNDVSMLREADIKIVMETAPIEMHSLATFIAPSSRKQGIIPALEQAIQNAKK